ncbi:hypothetical protein JCGZ_21643 [Jatropha curcas]|uniref:Subtilisin-like protease SBT5.6 n=1 Tax=Jatropha curcas TaxID=180498 RepID=A0A067JBM2_JATCU|nr:subtilisin-like protease SBT5.6 [Jatropha curcas]KDP21172.1 hypothetical protein JCGZ_21643 [Jatropha curcas]
MNNQISPFFLLLLLLPLWASCADRKVYIVHFGEQHNGYKTLHEIEETHVSSLSSIKETEEEARNSLLYSYKHGINGLAALLTPEEASKLSEMDGVVSVYASNPTKYSLQTTRSWEFVGLDEGEEPKWNHHFKTERELPLKAGYGKGVIVGVLDSGVWPESKSFSDEGMGTIPKLWKGICQTGPGFNSSHCNKKIIGARYYVKGFETYYGRLNATEDFRSPRDVDGHGTHTASTVAGRVVHNASAYGGFAAGTASGGAPLAHLAIYKACWAIPNQEKANGNTCFEEDMLAAIDDAIADGVHVLSVSIGTTEPITYDQDGLAIGAFRAIKKNIVMACAAGNSGPAPSTLSNPAPWIITVGASTLDRAFLGPLVLGNGIKIMGQTVTPGKLDKAHPLVYAGDVAAHGVLRNQTNQCLPNSLSPKKVKGKIVLCIRGAGTRIEKGMEVRRAGGAGFILGNSKAYGNDIPADAHVLPATALGYNDALKVLKYIRSTKNPTAIIEKAHTLLRHTPAPSMASFTSRGPNTVDPNILKPDITAPGVNILAAWSGGSSPTKLSSDHRIVEYNIESGTSMATPHVAATAALLKAIHPTWSSAAIRSAIMTTAWTKNNEGNPITDSFGKIADPFQLGSGHFRPAKAADPGLVYDASFKDYVQYLCGYDHDGTHKKRFGCPKKPEPTYNLNYPSIAVSKIKETAVIIKRSVTNVGDENSIYFFTAKPPFGFSIEASPSVLYFDRIDQKKSFNITVRARNFGMAKKIYKDDYAFGWYTWTDNYHYVRSPIAVSVG